LRDEFPWGASASRWRCARTGHLDDRAIQAGRPGRRLAVYNRASTGTYFERVLDRLGIADAVKAKTVRHPDGSTVMEHLLRGTGREGGIGPAPEIRAYESKGVQPVGPLPPDIQNYTAYVAGILAGARAPDAGAALIR